MEIGPQSHTEPQPIQGTNFVEPQQLGGAGAVQEPSAQVQPVAESAKGTLINIYA